MRPPQRRPFSLLLPLVVGGVLLAPGETLAQTLLPSRPAAPATAPKKPVRRKAPAHHAPASTSTNDDETHSSATGTDHGEHGREKTETSAAATDAALTAAPIAQTQAAPVGEPPAPTQPEPAATEPPATAPPTIEQAKVPEEPPKETKHEHWYDKIKFRGYTQLRYARVVDGDDKIKFAADKTVSADNGFFIRRARLIVQGDPFDILSIYLQPDFAGASSGDTLHLTAMRDWYADIYLDPSTKMFRFRVGQSKVPFGWEPLQSSSNRLNMDRSDGINSSWASERDLGIMFYAETQHARKLFKELTESGLKGSGDYGVLGVGIINGQTINKAEKNDDKHVVVRLTYPFELGSQILELGASAYTGQFIVTTDDKLKGADPRVIDRRVGAHVIVYPKPIGFQAEYNVGYGPEKAGSQLLRAQPLDGGYALLNARLYESFFPFVRVARYDGGRKETTNAPRDRIFELEGGVEYTFFKAVELTAAANWSQREHDGKLLEATVVRTQVQFNY